LYDDAESIVNIVSQTDIVKFLSLNRAQLGRLAKRTAASLGWCPKRVVAVTPEVAAIEAMALMNEKRVSAVAVVDAPGGRIIGNFSVSEMRTIMAEHFGALALPVAEFLALEHGTEFAGYGARPSTVRCWFGVFWATRAVLPSHGGPQ
jgi:5'-AMP-activated protein kinase regulatory gamma subunit